MRLLLIQRFWHEWFKIQILRSLWKPIEWFLCAKREKPSFSSLCHLLCPESCLCNGPAWSNPPTSSSPINTVYLKALYNRPAFQQNLSFLLVCFALRFGMLRKGPLFPYLHHSRLQISFSDRLKITSCSSDSDWSLYKNMCSQTKISNYFLHALEINRVLCMWYAVKNYFWFFLAKLKISLLKTLLGDLALKNVKHSSVCLCVYLCKQILLFSQPLFWSC